jgi:hypothetical protein
MTASSLATTTAGSTIAISAAAPAANTKTGYSALTFTEIGEVSDLGTLGRTYNTVTFSPVASRGVRKIKGSFDDGQMPLKIAHAPGDPGQVILAAALDDDAFYSFELTLQDGTIKYFRAQVSSYPVELGGVDSITMSTVNLEVMSGTIITVLPA